VSVKSPRIALGFISGTRPIPEVISLVKKRELLCVYGLQYIVIPGPEVHEIQPLINIHLSHGKEDQVLT
ncbi:hypothetical protein STEG23_008421, partial [Scotinomys teguina]